jgi:Fic family protein
MVILKKRETSGKTYYYLHHTYREKGKLKTIETYIGTKVPSNIDSRKREFLFNIYKEKWFPKFEKIKKEYSKERRTLPLEVREKSLENFAIRFTYDTNRIEGSKLSFRDTADLLEFGISPNNRPISDIKEAEAHKKVFYEMIVFDGNLSVGITLKWHKELFDATKPSLAGKLRTYRVYITNSKFLPPTPLEVIAYISELFKWYSRERAKTNPIELAALFHVKFEEIHPFGDGNGRIGRLLMNFILNKNCYPMLDIKYTNRRSYYNALERSQIKKDYSIFVNWFFKKYMKDNSRYLKS